MNKDGISLALAAVGLYFVIVSPDLKQFPIKITPNSPQPAPIDTIVEPSAELKALVAPMTGVAGEDPNAAADMAGFFDTIARWVEDGRIKGTSELVSLNTDGGDLLLSEPAKRRWSTIGSTARDVLASYVGLTDSQGTVENKTIDGQMRIKLASAYKAMAWAVMQKQRQVSYRHTVYEHEPVNTELTFYLAVGGWSVLVPLGFIGMFG